MKNRAQSSLEYLITYGWAILVLSIVGIAIWQMGILRIPCPEKLAQGFSEIQVLDQSVSGINNQLTLVLVNNGGSRVNITNVTATINSVSCNANTTESHLRPGAQERRVLSCSLQARIGDCYVGNVSITYTTLGSGISHTSYGMIRGSIE